MSEATVGCPFSGRDGCLAIKDLEKRWGLTLVSFLPHGARERVKSLQEAMSAFSCFFPPPADPEVEFYAPEYLHCTHLTLTRSNAWGPVRGKDFVRPSHQLFELFDVIHQNSSRMKPLGVTLNHLRMSEDGVSIVLTGICSDDGSTDDRRMLLGSLNVELKTRFDVAMRPWDIDESKFHKLHCRIAFLKRPLATRPAFRESLEKLAGELRPISCTFETITLVHHRYRTLEPPHEGKFEFPLGRDLRAESSAATFASQIRMR